MLEDQVASLLQRLLGNYVRGFNKEALKISVWKGDVELTNMQLKPEALNALKLPVKVKAGFLGSVKLKVPWSRLGQDPVLVYLDRIFLLAEPATQVDGLTEDVVQEAKKSRVREMEMKLLEKAQQLTSEMNTSWLGSLINTIIGNLKLSISNIHIRYEDLESNPEHPFAAGVTLGKLSAVTVDDNGMETFVSGGALDRIQKSVELDQLAIYLDSDISPWNIDKSWEDLLPSEWLQVFRFGTKDGKPADHMMVKHSYILQPVTGDATYSKLRRKESANSDQPLQKAVVNLNDVTLSLSKDGYRDILKLADNFAAFNQRLKFAHYRPLLPVKSNPRSWWRYAYKAVSDQTKKASGKLSWEQVLRCAGLRKRYISLYASLLKSDPSHEIVDDNEEIEELDRELDIELILQWRMLAHKYVKQSMESDRYSRKQKPKTSWWSFGWNNKSDKDESEQFHFSEEDWEQLNKLIGYREGENEQSVIINEKADTLNMSLEVHMKHNASKLVDGAREYIAELSCEDLDCSIKLYPETKVFDLKLGSYQLSSPNGLLAESATASGSLVGVFYYKPFDAKVDWSMAVKAAPCYMTYLKDSIDGIINFFESSNAVSQTIALETAAAVQMTFDGVKRSAQQQVNRALKDHARFLLDLDIAAPKITIPTEFYPDNIHSTKLLLDLGNLVIRSEDDYERRLSEDQNMYLQFDLVLSDVCAFLVDGDYRWSQTASQGSASSVRSEGVSFLPVIDRCGVIVTFQQIRLENPSYPSTRLSVRVPSLGFHFSPARYHRLMRVAKIFQEEGSENSDLLRPWNQSDFEGWLSLLIRKGMGNREAVWQRRYICLVGPFLYVLENLDSKSYKHYLSLRGKQVYHLPAELLGGVEHVLTICDAARPLSKVVEDANALILLCDSDDSQRNWQSRLQGAIYSASGSAPITTLSETSSDPEDSETELNDSGEASNILKMERIFITGALDELKICFNYNRQRDLSFVSVLLAEENHLFEFRAIGGQVELSIRENDMFIGTVLKSLEIEDLVCCNGVSQPCFLARSFVQSSDVHLSFDDTGNQTFDNNNSTPSEGEDKFYEAPENLVNSDYPSPQNSLSSEYSSFKPPSFSRVAGLLPGDVVQARMDDIEIMNTMDSFVKAQIVIYDQNSSLYKNIDTQVTVSLATLSFFCRRPTILAIMEFVNAINVEDEKCETFSENSPSAMVKHDSSGDDIVDDQDLTTIEEPAVKGLLGKGKSRIIFNLILKMDRAQILLMHENETKFATLSQDNLLTDIKVFPSSFSIKAALGNLRISDDSLPGGHAYFWICDMRNYGGSSFVELVFTSFSADDEDYEGYEYSLFGQLSEVRIVYLNRFIQEVVSYFMGLIPNNSKNFVKLKDQVTNSEKWFTTSEIEGSPALKLDLSLRKPIILMPRRTDSPDYLKLDVVHITIQNTFQWLGGSKGELHAVHLEILTIKVEDINLNVGSGTELGESIIQDVNGVSILIRRSLRDLLHQIPITEAAIKMEELKAALTSRDYQIITECATSNISETPHTVPPLNHDSVASSADVVKPIALQDPSGVEAETRNGEAWISLKVSVAINLVELCLYAGVARDASLATIKVSGAWLLYKSNNAGEGFLSATLKGFTVIDDREGTEEEFRLAVGMPEKIGYSLLHLSSDDENQHISDLNVMKQDEIKPVPTMLIFDAKFGQYSTFISLCVQRPQLLVALDFLLAVAEFFVPTVGDMLSNEESRTPMHEVDAVVLDQPIYQQSSAEISLSPLRPLIVDDERFDHFTYDGKGGILHLKDRQGVNLSAPSKEAIIYVGSGKKLQFKNVVIKNGKYLDSCIFLGSDSGYSVSRNDQVQLEGQDDAPLTESSRSINDQPSEDTLVDRSTEFIIELQAISPELTFYNTSKDVGVPSNLSNKLLHAQLDAFARLVLKGNTIEMTANVLGLMMESNGITILEPFDTSVKYSNASGKTNIHLSVSDIFMNFTFSILRLFLAVEEDILSFLRMTSKKTIPCSQFDKVGTITNPYTDQIYAFWRPCAPPGYAILGDYLTPLDKPPTKGVVAVNTNFARVKRPISFKLIWPPLASEEISGQDVANSSFLLDSFLTKEGNYCSIWFPEAPKGYVALGCVVSPGRTQPPLSAAFCISASLVSSCSLKDCITINSVNLYQSTLAFWRVDNSVGTFLPADPVTLSLIGRAYELRDVKFGFLESSSASSGSDVQASPSGNVDIQPENSTTVNSGRGFEAVASFQLIWWNQGSSSRNKLSIWRPVVPHGMVYFGDIAVTGYEPPNTCVVLHDTEDGVLFKAPLSFQPVGQIKKQRGMDSISFWMPQAPPGFVSLGSIACKGPPKQFDFSKLRCMRSDMVTQDRFLEESLWDTSDARYTKESFSIWSVGNELGTFLVRSGLKKPPRRFALKLADPNLPSGSDDTVIDAEVRTFSAAIFDDYGGLMVPLFNAHLTGIGFSLHGRADYLNSTASFSLVARSYNDKYESWEPLVESVDGYLRYQYDLNAPGAASQLRLTTSRDLNINVSVSNANMIIQAYASWSNLSHADEYHKKREAVSPTHGLRSVIDVHQRRNYYIIPQNKLGQDIFIRAAENAGFSNVLRMPSGDMMPVKVPVSKNMMESHLKGKLSTKDRTMVTVAIVDAELPRVRGLTSNLYVVALRLTPNQNLGSESLLHQQSARTSGSISNFLSDEQQLVNWSEIFFFKVDSPDKYLLELIVTDLGKGDTVGFFSAPLNQIAGNIKESSYQFDYLNYLTWIDLSSSNSMTMTQGDEHTKSSGRIRCAVLLSPRSEAMDKDEVFIGKSKSGFIQISPSMEGPWTTVRLHYAAPAACWRLGNDVIASEVSVRDGNIYVNMRSLVSVRNNTDFILELCLVPKTSKENIRNIRSLSIASEPEGLQIDGSTVQTDEIFETENYNPSLGWVGYSNYSDGGDHNQEISRVGLPSGWEWTEDWHLDTLSVNDADGWVYSPDVESLKWPESSNPLEFANHARQRRWIRTRKQILYDVKQEVSVGSLKPGDSMPLPLPALTQSGVYILQLKPSNVSTHDEYSWSYMVDKPGQPEGFGEPKDSGICISSLTESEELLYCSQISGTSSKGSHKLWFCVSIQATEIAKDIRCDPIEDWCLVVKSPLTFSNCLPLAAEYSVLNTQPRGHFVACARGVFSPGETVKVHTADIRKPLFLSLLPQKGWVPMHEAVLISHPSGLPSKTISLRSSISGRIVQLVLDHNYDKEQPLLAKIIRVYAPYWFSITRCPPLRFRLVDLAEEKNPRKIALPFRSKRRDQEILGEITEEEIYEGHTIASALNFNLLGLSASITRSDQEQHFGPVKDLSPLGDMDGSLDFYAYDADGNCMWLFVSTKPCPYQSVPTKVIYVRPFMTFTNRIGQDMFIKLNSEDEPKVLRASDSRIAFAYRKTTETDKIQVRLQDTEWSFPVQISKEDTIFLVLRGQNHSWRFFRTEIRGYEEGSRFIVVFRPGSSDGPIRIENRTDKMISIRQSGFGDNAWIKLEPLSTKKFAWEDPYGQKIVDAMVDSDSRNSIWKLDMEGTGISSAEDAELGLQFHVVEMGDVKVGRFTNYQGSTSREESMSLTPAGNWGTSHVQSAMQNAAAPIELIVELGVVGISVVDHRPKELSYMYLERVFVSYSTGYDGGSTSRFKLILGNLQIDNQLPLTLMPVLFAPEQTTDTHHPVFKMTFTIRNESTDGIQVYPRLYIRVRLQDTEWSFPVQISKEDTIFLVLRGQNHSWRFFRTEIRGYEEGSRFIVVFRPGSSDGPIRIENRTDKMISIRQSGFGDNAWIKLEPLSTKKFAWEDPYGQKIVDAMVDSDSRNSIWKLDMEGTGISSAEDAELGLQFHVVEMGDVKVGRFTNYQGSTSREESMSLTPAGNWGTSHVQSAMQNAAAPIELIVELGVVGISVVDHRPKELSYMYLERVFVSYSTGYDGGSTSRFKLILGNLQIDNQLPLTLMPVLFAPEQTTDTHHPVFKMTFTIRNESTDGIQVYPRLYIRVTDKVWRLNIHEPIIWALVDFYNNLQLDRVPQSSNVTEVDPEIHIGLIDVSEIRLKVSLETEPSQRPHGVLGVWSPILSAVGNALKIQVHLRRVMHRDRFMRKSSIAPAIQNRIWRDLIHNPLHLIFSVDVLGMTSSTLSSLSKGFAELSTDGQFLQLRSKQVGSRRITGVGDGIIQGTEAFAQGVAFGVSGVLTKPVESARQNGFLGLAHGLGRAFIGFIVQPVSGALDFFSLTVDGIGASCSKCLGALNNKTTPQRFRNPRAIRADGILREYSEKEASGQMILYLAEASRHFGCTEIFKEPSKFAWSDYYKDHFFVPYQKIVLVTNKRVMLLRCFDLDKIDKKPSKIMWDVAWEELMALELAKAGCHQPSHLLLHLKSFKRSENFVRVIKCNVGEESEDTEAQATKICSVVRRVWKAYKFDMKTLVLKVPSSQRHVYFAWSEADGREPHNPNKAIIKSRELSSSNYASDEGRFVKHAINFLKIWSSEQESKGRCKLYRKQVTEDGGICSIWRPICPDGYISIGDIAHVGGHPPNVAAVYRNTDRLFALPLGYDLVWRNCQDDYKAPVSVWHPRAPEGYVSPGCVAVSNFEEPEPCSVYCVAESLVEETEFEEQKVWSAPDSYPWACHIYQVRSDALHFVALRQTKEESDWKPMRVADNLPTRLQLSEPQ